MKNLHRLLSKKTLSALNKGLITREEALKYEKRVLENYLEDIKKQHVWDVTWEVWEDIVSIQILIEKIKIELSKEVIYGLEYSLEDIMKKQIEKYIFKNIGWDGMEVAIYKNGDYGVRQVGSFGEDEDLVKEKINLSGYYWSDTMVDWFGEDWRHGELDSEVVKEFIKEEIFNNYLNGLK